MPTARETGARPLALVAVAGAICVDLLVGWFLGLRSDLEGLSRRRHRDDLDIDFALVLPGALFAVAGAIGVAVAFRRPKLGFVITAATLIGFGWLGGFPPAILIPLGVVVFRLVREIGIGGALPWLAVVPVIAWSSWWGEPGLGVTSPRFWGWVLTATALMFLPALGAVLVTTRLESRRREHAEELQRAAQAERLRVVRDIHDVVGHSLSIITLQSGVALHLMDSDPGQVRASLEAIRDSAKAALAEVRHTLGVVQYADQSTGPLTPTPEVRDLPRLVQQVNEAGGQVTLTPIEQVGVVPSSVGAAAFRVVQESLTNALRHAPGSRVWVELARDPRALVVQVKDDGRPAETITEGTGLRGMRDRVETLAGAFQANPTPQGFVVTATFPIGPDSEPDERLI